MHAAMSSAAMANISTMREASTAREEMTNANVTTTNVATTVASAASANVVMPSEASSARDERTMMASAATTISMMTNAARNVTAAANNASVTMADGASATDGDASDQERHERTDVSPGRSGA